MPRGGARPNSGPKKGFKFPKTLDKEAAREKLREMVRAQLEPLVAAHVEHALGIKHFFLKDEKGKFVRIEDPKAIEVALNSGEEGKYYWIFTKDPDVRSFDSLMDRTLDKPAQHVAIEANVNLGLEDRIRAARTRLNGK